MGAARSLMGELETPFHIERAIHADGVTRMRVYAHPDVRVISGNAVLFNSLISGRFLEDGVTCEIPSLTGPATRVRIPSLEAYRWVSVVEQLCLRFNTQFHRWSETRTLEVPEACEPALEHLFWKAPFHLLSDGRESMPEDYFGVIRSSVPPENMGNFSCPAFRILAEAERVQLHCGYLQSDPSLESGWKIHNTHSGDLETGPSTYFLCER